MRQIERNGYSILDPEFAMNIGYKKIGNTSGWWERLDTDELRNAAGWKKRLVLRVHL